MSVQLIEASEHEPARVLIAGGGVAALEALLALRAIDPRMFAIELLSPERSFVARPLSVGEPFGLSQPPELDLHELAQANGARFRLGSLGAVDSARRIARTADGEALGYEALLVATGARPRGVVPGALTFRGPGDVPAFRALLDEIEAGEVRSVAFAIPRGARWVLPIYELALMTAGWSAARGLTPRIELATHEPRPLDLFGATASASVKKLLSDAGVRLRTRVGPLVAQPGRLYLTPGGVIPADRTVAAAKLTGPAISGLPRGPGGFVPTDAHGRVTGAPHVYAAGDVTSFPVKQGGIAAQQADAAAAAIAADAGIAVEPESFEPVMRGILLTGGAPEYLRRGAHEEAGQAATAPLCLPAAKIAGRHLGAYLAGGNAEDAQTLEDLPVPATGRAAALALALDAADAAAGWDDPRDALRWLRVAEGLNVALPMGYADKRREWTRLTQEKER